MFLPRVVESIPDQNFIEINTEKILFIAGGAFDGIERHISRRLNLNVIGYKSTGKDPFLGIIF